MAIEKKIDLTDAITSVQMPGVDEVEESDDEDYYVDDENVEWWRDDDGQWWYRTPGNGVHRWQTIRGGKPNGGLFRPLAPHDAEGASLGPFSGLEEGVPCCLLLISLSPPLCSALGARVLQEGVAGVADDPDLGDEGVEGEVPAGIIVRVLHHALHDLR